MHGVMIHHTVTSGTQNSVDICYNGHSSLPGPLCHGVIAKDGTVHMVGNGRANHAGLGDDDVLRAVINETALPGDNEANTDGNRSLLRLRVRQPRRRHGPVACGPAGGHREGGGRDLPGARLVATAR